jgi:diacylglycerol kinase family enzyme
MSEIQENKTLIKNKHRMQAKLIFNPGSGETNESPVQLMDVISAMQDWKLVPEAYLVEPGCDLVAMVQKALLEGIRMFVVCGGDGTIDAVAGTLVGTNATLGIIPTGTKNNVALSLGIPSDIPAAIAILRSGQRLRVDVGLVTFGEITRPFLEVCSVGLLSALYPAADDIQHGNISRIGDLLGTLVSSPPAEIHLLLNGKKKIKTQGHAVLVSNTPYIGPHFQVGTPDSLRDGLLDVLSFADLSKMELLDYAVQAAGSSPKLEDERIQHYHVHRVDITTNPATLVVVDGVTLGKGPLRIRVRRHTLAVMVPAPFSEQPVNGSPDE